MSCIKTNSSVAGHCNQHMYVGACRTSEWGKSWGCGGHALLPLSYET